MFDLCGRGWQADGVGHGDAALLYDSGADRAHERDEVASLLGSQVLPGRQGKQVGAILDVLIESAAGGSELSLLVEQAPLLHALACSLPLFVAPAAIGLEGFSRYMPMRDLDDMRLAAINAGSE